MRRTGWMKRVRWVVVGIFWALISGHGASQASAADDPAKSDARSFTIRTTRLEATFEDGMVVYLKNLGTGEVHADSALADYGILRGLGHLNKDPESAAKLHCPWGSRAAKQQYPHGAPCPHMHHPYSGSKVKIVTLKDGHKQATWTGLSNGRQNFPDETLTVEAWADSQTQALCFKASATSSEKGVYGVQVPIANLHADHAFYIPSFGGEMYDKNMEPGLNVLEREGPFLEAPVVAVEGRQGSLGLWTEDDKFHPSFLFFDWSGKSFALAFEHLNLMPFEPYTRVDSVVYHVDVFDGGWVDAMTPFRDWYARLFAEEMKTRDGVKWADKIRVVIDDFTHTNENYRKLATIFDPETVLIQEWDARAPSFGQELPDWTPRKEYVERVKTLHRLGFKTMAYVCSYCVNYNSPVFKRDRIQEFTLPRKISMFWRYTRPYQTFESMKGLDGKLMYLDPLSAWWRKYHTDMMIRWREETGTDANYEDTAGCAMDFGNGIVDGLFGGQGCKEMFRELLRRNPTVPMSGEDCQDAIGFALRWVLHDIGWGGDQTKTFWMARQRPVLAYLYGSRIWIRTQKSESNFMRHAIVASSDAVGGMAQSPAKTSDLEAMTGITFHMKWRAKFFANKQLTPYFVRDRCEKNLACLYKDAEGNIYKYYTTGDDQVMLGPNGEEIYRRFTGKNGLETSLCLPSWPATAEGKLFGLNPQARYALVPGGSDETRVRVTSLPEGVKITRYYDADDFTLLVLEPVDAKGPKRGEVGFSFSRNPPLIQIVLLSDERVNVPSWNAKEIRHDPIAYETAFPARFLFVRGEVEAATPNSYFGEAAQRGRFIITGVGLDRGGIHWRKGWSMRQVPGEEGRVPFISINGGTDSEVVYDFLARVPTKDSTRKVYVVNFNALGTDGTIARLYVNGQVVHEQEFASQPNPNWKGSTNPRNPHEGRFLPPSHNFQAWHVPLGHMAGKPVLVSYATDPRLSDNGDSQYWSKPMFIQDPAQKALFAEWREEKREK